MYHEHHLARGCVQLIGVGAPKHKRVTPIEGMVTRFGAILFGLNELIIQVYKTYIVE